MKLFEDYVFGAVHAESELVPFRIRGAGHFSNDSFHKQKIRICNFVELFWCVEGSCEFKYSDGIHTLTPGCVCFYNTGCLHDYTPSSKGFHYYWLSIEGPLAEKFFQGFHPTLLPRYAGNCPEELFSRLMLELAARDAQSIYRALATGIRILCAALTPTSDEIERCPDYAMIVKHLIDENYSNHETTINFLAEQVHLHRVYLSRLFHKKIGMSPSQYILKKRIECAIRLLKENAGPISQIALECGFSDPAYFMRIMKKKTGFPPAALRKR